MITFFIINSIIAVFISNHILKKLLYSRKSFIGKMKNSSPSILDLSSCSLSVESVEYSPIMLEL